MENIKQWFFETDSVTSETDFLQLLIRMELFFNGTNLLEQALSNEINSGNTTDNIVKGQRFSDEQYNSVGLYRLSQEDREKGYKDGDLLALVNDRISAVFFNGDWWLKCSPTEEFNITKPIKIREVLGGSLIYSVESKTVWRFRFAE